MLYLLKTEGTQDYEFGDTVKANMGATFHIIDQEKTPTLNILSEVIGQFANKDEQEGDTIEDTGGTVVFLAPGVSSQLTENLTTTLSVPIPVHQHLGGIHQELDFSVLFSVSYAF
ncbi:MAG: hypothetical protein MRJ65_14795 [Candidatus Brocadiaceae bacterium]|nr:hypothetical protein [Candidatus Brocadiaceae bacterium]